MRLAFTLIMSAAVVVSTCAAVEAEAKVRIVPAGSSGAWKARAVYASSGLFDHCSAVARYKSGTRLSIIVYQSGNWRLWFAHDAWPDRGNTAFPARLEVDGRVMLSQNGYYKGRNAYIDLGANVARVKALMVGQTMSIVTPAGVSKFSLSGTNQATQLVARCWRTHFNARPPAGAFGSANKSASGGAFGAPAVVAPPAKSSTRNIELSRANTMEIAANYLSKAALSYSILPKDKAPLKHFPVNWKLQDGSIGGMRVFKDTNVAVDALLGTLLSDQAKHCVGRNASEREAVKVIRGRKMIRARGVCATGDGKVLNTTYKVAELGQRMVMMVMELRSAAAAPAQNGLSSKAAPETGLSSDKNQGIIVPGPNEL